MKQVFSITLFLAGVLYSIGCTTSKEALTTKNATPSMGYTMINSGEQITIYKYVHAAHSPKEAEKYAPKYFFTVSSSEALQELTKMNLKKAFPDNHAFHDALDVNFKEDKELINYDDFHKMYKVSWIYKNTVI